MKCLACMLEESSAEEMLKGVLSRILPEEEFDLRFVTFEGKQDLEKNIERKLRSWRRPETFFLVMRDQDAGDCHKIKKSLTEKVRSGGKLPNTCIRIACRELESFYLGDLAAVERGLSVQGLSRRQSKIHNPDSLTKPSKKLKELTKEKYSKVKGSRAIAPRLRLDGNNKSRSFNILVEGLRRLTGV